MDLVLEFLKNQIKLTKEDKVVVGVSAGPDSMCLLHLLLELRKKIGFQIIVAHINHQKRPESQEEETFLKGYCHDNDCLIETMRIEKYSHENFHKEAREIRYKFYEDVINKYEAPYLMTAHHGDDLIETILMRLVRGSTLNGYQGISLISNMHNYLIIRPLLYVTKEDIMTFNEVNSVPYRIDNSNFSDKYTRNRYRRNVLPFLKEENRRVHLKFLKFSETLQENNNYIEKITTNAYNNLYKDGKLDILAFKNEDILIRKRLLEKILSNYYTDLASLTSKHINILLEVLAKNKSGTKINLPKGVVALIEYDYLKIIKEEKKSKTYKFELKDGLELPNGMKFLKYDGPLNGNDILHLSSKDVQLPLYVRNKNPGDVIELKGTKGSKKVSAIFIDKKISRDLRGDYPIVCDANNKIVWLPKLKKSKYDSQNRELCDIIFRCL